MVPHTDPAAVARRTLLRGALAVPGAALAVPLVAGSSAAAAQSTSPESPKSTDSSSPNHSGQFDQQSQRFALAVLPDTQYLFDADSSDPAPLRETFRYLVSERRDANIAFMTHLGDVTEHGTSLEIGLAGKAFTVIDGKMPYSVLAGNHDVQSSTDDQRGDTPYLSTFGPNRFKPMPTFGGASPDGYNSYHVLTAAGRDWLVLALDWRISDQGLTWAQGVLDQHDSLPAILTTHDLAFADDAGEASLSPNGQRMWDQLIRKNDQIFLTLNGHYWPPGRTVLTNDAGHPVYVHITNYQDRYYGGAGMIRLYNFDLVRKVIDVETFSPWFLATDPEKRSLLTSETIELTGPVDRFSLDVDFAARFNGFAPVTPPAPRPPSAVLPRGTVAYWRFDQTGLTGLAGVGTSGSPVPTGTVARDLSGHGNDLSVQILHSGGPDMLTWSPEHHLGQPAQASLYFDGGQSPDRGAVLQTGPAAPLNSLKFDSGYTVEVFLKLPDPFVGDHAFMGILSWEGRAGDAGKTNGYSPDESIASLNLSSERFLQYAVYPDVQNAQPTSWSHALPTGEWTHVAIVNDGTHTIVYVDGSPIVRNPKQPSQGIAALGKPFALGGTQFAEQFGQGYYGWLGDVRIVSRALRPAEFLTPSGR